MSAALFTPFASREATSRNRIVVSPMCQYLAVDGVPQDWHLAHHARFALGGVGVGFVEATGILRDGRITHGCTGLWNGAQEAAMARIAALYRKHGALPAIQIGHAGAKAATARPWEGAGPLPESGPEPMWETIGASAVAMRPGWRVPRPATRTEIDEVIHAFGEAAKRAVRAGFAIIELHGAHGYLLHEFVSPVTNKRTDEFGGDPQRRMRLPLLVAETVRRAVPDDIALWYRASVVDHVEGGLTVEDSVVLARELKARGVDLIDCSAGGIQAAVSLLVQRHEHGFQVPLARAIRDGAGIPTMAVGLITDPVKANAVIAEGHADLVALAREMIANPSWAYRAALELGEDKPDHVLPPPYAFYLERRAAAQGRA